MGNYIKLQLENILTEGQTIAPEYCDTDHEDIVKPEDIPFLAQSAYDDACRPGNPKETSVEDITKLYESLI